MRALKLIHNPPPPPASFSRSAKIKFAPELLAGIPFSSRFDPTLASNSKVSLPSSLDLRPCVFSSICFARDEAAIRSSNRLWPNSRYSLLLVPLATFIFPLHFDFFPLLVLSPRSRASIFISILPLPPPFYLTRSLSPLSSLPYSLSLSLSVRLCLVSSWRGASQRSCGQGVGGSDSIIRY